MLGVRRMRLQRARPARCTPAPPCPAGSAAAGELPRTPQIPTRYLQLTLGLCACPELSVGVKAARPAWQVPRATAGLQVRGRAAAGPGHLLGRRQRCRQQGVQDQAQAGRRQPGAEARHRGGALQHHDVRPDLPPQGEPQPRAPAAAHARWLDAIQSGGCRAAAPYPRRSGTRTRRRSSPGAPGRWPRVWGVLDQPSKH